jgi:PAS domain S-box-containing protein
MGRHPDGGQDTILRQLLEEAAGGFWEWKPLTGEYYVSPAYMELLELDERSFAPGYDSWVEMLHPEDREVAARAVMDLDEGLTDTLGFDFRVRKASGTYQWVRCRGRCLERDERGRIGHAVGTLMDISEYKQVEERYRELIENQGEGIGIVDAEECFVFANPAAEEIFGLEPGTMVGRSLREFVDEEQFEAISAQTQKRRTGDRSTYEIGFLHAGDGSRRTMLVTATPRHAEDGTYAGAFGIFHDITDRKRLEDQLVQAQKMESVGRLAGGIAHDFNNLLSPILMLADMALLENDPSDPTYADWEQVRTAAMRAKDLTQQLLAFGRKQVLKVKNIDLNQVVSESYEILSRLIREDIEIELHLTTSPGTVRADPTQIQQVLMNLAINARDSMPEGGNLIISTREVVLDNASTSGPEQVEPGRHVCLCVRDTGAGMDPKILEHIFEPFFSTKGQGTGLGLSMVHGIVRQHGGHITVESEPGHGTEFRIFLPVIEARAERIRLPASIPPTTLSGQTVLVAEDDDLVRRQLRRILERYGLSVIDAANGEEALERAHGHDGPIHLLLTDVVMPRMNGRELHDRLREFLPGLDVVYISGYTYDVISEHGVLENDTRFVQKPYTVEKLMEQVKDALEG